MFCGNINPRHGLLALMMATVVRGRHTRDNESPGTHRRAACARPWPIFGKSGPECPYSLDQDGTCAAEQSSGARHYPNKHVIAR